MESATSFGGPFVLLPSDLFSEWVVSIGDKPEPDSGLYGEVCGTNSHMHRIRFKDRDVLRIGEDPGDLYWLPNSSGGLIIQWIAADSLEQLLEFGRFVAEQDSWTEELDIEVVSTSWRLMDSCGFDDDEQPKVDLVLERGLYRVSATYQQNDSTMATVYQLKHQA
ncbi:Imm21 family immunity protein [Roseibacillus persicicus]|nr:Imm21 family immunity protein [Roseibacillus persicicus]